MRPKLWIILISSFTVVTLIGVANAASFSHSTVFKGEKVSQSTDKLRETSREAAPFTNVPKSAPQKKINEFGYAYVTNNELISSMQSVSESDSSKEAEQAAGVSVRVTATVLPTVLIYADQQNRVQKLVVNTPEREVNRVVFVGEGVDIAMLKWSEITEALNNTNSGTGVVWQRNR